MQATLLSTPPHSKVEKIQELLKDLQRNSWTFQGKMEFKDFSMTPPKIQGLFKTVRTMFFTSRSQRAQSAIVHLDLSAKRDR